MGPMQACMHARAVPLQDPNGAYVRKWVPELARLPLEFLHQPWAAHPKVLEAAGVTLGGNYPRRIITVRAAAAACAVLCCASRGCAR